MQRTNSPKGLLFLIIAAVIWGFAFVAQRLGSESVMPFTFNGIRYLLGAVSLIPVIFIFERGARDRKQHRTTLLSGILAGSLLWAAFLPKLEHWFGNKGAYAISLLVGAAGFISVMFVHNQYVLWLSYLLIGAAWAAMLALPFTIITNAISGSKHMGALLGLFNCTICIPQIAAALCGGLLLKYICAHVQAGMLVVAGALLILGAAAVALIKEK